MIEIREEDLSGKAVQELLALHLAEMHGNSPPGEVFALDLSGLRAPNITVWSAWDGLALAGIAALRVHDGETGELKSMRTHPMHLRKGVAGALLRHIVAEARRRRLRRLHLETGSGPAFEAAMGLYRKFGFVDAGEFADYRPSAFSRFLSLDLNAMDR